MFRNRETHIGHMAVNPDVGKHNISEKHNEINPEKVYIACFQKEKHVAINPESFSLAYFQIEKHIVLNQS